MHKGQQVKNLLKMTKGKNKSISFYLTIIKYLDQGMSLHQIAAKIDMSKQNLNYYNKWLKMLNIAEYAGYGTWRVNHSNIPKLKEFLSKKLPHKVKQVKNSDPLYRKIKGGLKENDIRSHAIQCVLKVRKIRNWNKDKRRSYLKKIDVNFVPIQQGERFFIESFRVWLTNISIVIWVPYSFFAEGADTGYSYGVYEFLRIAKRVERLMKVDFRISGKHVFRVTRQHHALIKNSLAKQYNKEKKKLYVFDERGLWLTIDYSNQIDEVEVLSNRGKNGIESRENCTHIQKVFNEFKSTGLTPEKIMHMIKEQSDSISGLIKNHEIFGENMKSHIGAIRTLSQETKSLGLAVEKNARLHEKYFMLLENLLRDLTRS